jgi:hypothetical protein
MLLGTPDLVINFLTMLLPKTGWPALVSAPMNQPLIFFARKMNQKTHCALLCPLRTCHCLYHEALPAPSL